MMEEPIPFGGWMSYSDDTVVYNPAEARKLQQQIAEQLTKPDQVNHPKHYTSHPSGVECIEITRHMGYNLGNAVKYIWRCDLKRDAIEDLRKAIWYLQDELAVREERSK
jgi:hypothetical protein